MERASAKNRIDPENLLAHNTQLAEKVLREALGVGVTEFCLCMGKRAAPLLWMLADNPMIPTTRWIDERAAAFYALGRARRIEGPVALITTSGTAAGELLPALMEAYYSGVPILAITSDRPRRFRGSGAPQSAEQVGLFGCYTPFSQDVARGESCSLMTWDRKGPAHLNVCFEEPAFADHRPTILPLPTPGLRSCSSPSLHLFREWSESVQAPLVIASGIPAPFRSSVVDFLSRLGAPIVAEATSGLWGEPRLSSLLLSRIENVWEAAERAAYPIDGILRVGRVPTLRMWRDLEERNTPVYSLSDLPFSGLSRGECLLLSDTKAWEALRDLSIPSFFPLSAWKRQDEQEQREREQLFARFPRSEPALIHALSRRIPEQSFIYLGNSLPIREWDFGAIRTEKTWVYGASRGVNGIDGQLSTFLGQRYFDRENWAIVGDQTALYDVGALHSLAQIKEESLRLIVINNRGGEIFRRMSGGEAMVNPHAATFRAMALVGEMEYDRWESIPDDFSLGRIALVEVIPDREETDLFWKEIDKKKI